MPLLDVVPVEMLSVLLASGRTSRRSARSQRSRSAWREITSEQERVADDLSRLIDDDLSRLIESANAPIFGVDLNGLVTEWNRKAAEISGFTKEETMGRSLVQNFIQPENRRSVSDVLNNAINGKETANFEFVLMSKHGQKFTVLLNATTRRDGKGNVTGVVGVGQDITELNKVGEKFTVLLNATTRRDGKGNITGVVGVGQDITELNKVLAQSKLVADDDGSVQEGCGRFDQID
eukprot:TRINITY_DN5377_c0_g1_i13.p2 TRINITY_DN5377_c0_g1~~TRINITY_DN5377_c0_g1_i13.p2  ORF type:complete len:235 (-),score=55.15 TRINITY_DN5377_c0_g1_i13:701-1405(-)